MCTSPVEAWFSKEVNSSGKRSLVFSTKDALEPDADPILVPCRGCLQCRIKHSKEWAIRCVHEAQSHEANSFITLTFDEPTLGERPVPTSLRRADYQLFLKRLRKQLPGVRLKYYFAGEYGELNGRPHYHAIIFGWDFPDKYHWQTKNGEKYYRSPLLEKVWPYGNSVIGNCTFESAAYVARYCMKKQTGKDSDQHYQLYDQDTGEMEVHTQETIDWMFHGSSSEKIPEPGDPLILVKEFGQPSLKTAIGREWFDKYHGDVYPNDFVVLGGRKMQPPKYYDRLLEEQNPFDIDWIKFLREQRAEERAARDERTPERFRSDQAKILQHKLNKLVRDL